MPSFYVSLEKGLVNGGTDIAVLLEQMYEAGLQDIINEV